MSSGKILIVDDEAVFRALLREMLRPEGYEFSFASDGKEAMELIKTQRVDLVLSDVRMPRMDGIQLASWVKSYFPAIELIMITGMADIELVVKTLELGAYDYILKPFQRQRVLLSVERALERRRLILEIKEHRENLEKNVKEVTRDLEDHLKRLSRDYQTILQILGAVLDDTDIEGRTRCVRIAKYAQAVAKRMGLKYKEITDLENAITLYYIGKINASEAGVIKLSPDMKVEWERPHQNLNGSLLKAVEFLEGGLPIICNQQECWDGTGRPRGVKGEEIPIGSRILAVIHAFDELISDQPYRKALSFAHVRERIAHKSGTQFDPKIVETFLEIPEVELLEIRRLAAEAVARTRKD